MELINGTDEPIEVEPGESIEVEADVDSRRGLVRRSSVVRVVGESTGGEDDSPPSRTVECNQGQRCDFEGSEGEMVVHLIREHDINSVIDRRDAIQSMLKGGESEEGEGVGVAEGRRCFCQGENPEWDYHHPTGCANTAQAFNMVAEVSTGQAWDEPRSGDGQ